MKYKISIPRLLHHWMSLVAGFIGGYALFGVGQFGSAQTANLIELTGSLINCSFTEFFMRAGAFLVYFSACFISPYLKYKGIKVKRVSIGIDAAACIAVGLIWRACPAILALYPFFFATAFHWNAFDSADGYASSPIFSSNNTRQLALSLGEYMYKRDGKLIDRAKFFAGSLLFFNGGAGLGLIMIKIMDRWAIFAALVLLAVSAVLLHLEEKETIKAKPE